MNPPTLPAANHADEIRRAFDQTFASAPSLENADLISLITIRLSGERFALRMDQIHGLARSRPIVPVSSRISELIGIAGMRGTLIPVFSLAALLGLPRSEECAWLAIIQGDLPLALAFDALERRMEIRRTSLYEDSSPSRRHVRQLAQLGKEVCAVLDVPSLVEVIRNMAEASRS
jgi:chemotaxis signal transduction protein